MVNSRYVYAYLHGLMSGPQSHKGMALGEFFRRRGKQLLRPNVNYPSGQPLPLTEALPYLQGVFREHGVETGEHPEGVKSRDVANDGSSVKLRIVGSSLGGYLAARYAELHAHQVDSLILLCPAVQIRYNLTRFLGEEQWKTFERNELFLPSSTRPAGVPVSPSGSYMVKVPYSLIEDADRHPEFPAVQCPTHVIHGLRDAVIPVSSSHAYADSVRRYRDKHGDSGGGGSPLTVEEVDDTHDLLAEESAASLHAAISRMWQID